MVAVRTPSWTWIWPAAGPAVILTKQFVSGGGFVAGAAAITLMGAVFAAVYHAEVIAHRIGEPFGTLVLALAVTTIETALIVSMMLGAPAEQAALARDTVFAAVMIVCNGIVGACLLAGGTRFGEQGFQIQGASSALAVLAVLTSMTLVFPNFTGGDPYYSPSQLAFAAFVSLVLYGSFVFIQTVRHRDYFLPEGKEDEHIAIPTTTAAMSAVLLLVSLVVIVALAKVLTPAVEAGVTYLHAPKAVVGIIIAALVLLPESLAAVRAARKNLLQTSLNLALGSALATIGLTIPAVATVSLLLNQPLELGLELKDRDMLALTIVLSVITLGTGRTTVLQGVVHLVLFAAFLFFAFVP
ncbi:ionic transporter y4hA [Bradyrhizobium sp. CB2312]|uniref:calcium:proton antiporter n=1 Tax=Bradyrhizobium sp. CB2312 TaxID=3039155 RepID=UPI0024B2387F|nr:ionic transporter y4hA [Bradyrhizobium sp. CB2312]WFU75533.1 ionic transporter y4hA [Bradyrhizobium sp. CB2312]